MKGSVCYFKTRVICQVHTLRAWAHCAKTRCTFKFNQVTPKRALRSSRNHVTQYTTFNFHCKGLQDCLGWMNPCSRPGEFGIIRDLTKITGTKQEPNARQDKVDMFDQRGDMAGVKKKSADTGYPKDRTKNVQCQVASTAGESKTRC